MPSLVPKLQREIPPVDLRTVFASDATAATLARVVKYVGHYFDNFSNRPETERDHPFQIVEEFDLLMPTEEAFFDEMRLCEAILRHGAGQISDEEIKSVLDAFIESHLYVYRAGVRSPKAGADVWADVPLVYVYSPSNERIAFTCNPIQSWFVWKLCEGEDLRVSRLND